MEISNLMSMEFRLSAEAATFLFIDFFLPLFILLSLWLVHFYLKPFSLHFHRLGWVRHLIMPDEAIVNNPSYIFLLLNFLYCLCFVFMLSGYQKYNIPAVRGATRKRD
jgi:hypothetical protein